VGRCSQEHRPPPELAGTRPDPDVVTAGQGGDLFRGSDQEDVGEVGRLAVLGRRGAQRLESDERPELRLLLWGRSGLEDGPGPDRDRRREREPHLDTRSVVDGRLRRLALREVGAFHDTERDGVEMRGEQEQRFRFPRKGAVRREAEDASCRVHGLPCVVDGEEPRIDARGAARLVHELPELQPEHGTVVGGPVLSHRRHRSPDLPAGGNDGSAVYAHGGVEHGLDRVTHLRRMVRDRPDEADGKLRARGEGALLLAGGGEREEEEGSHQPTRAELCGNRCARTRSDNR
jgi:hypothetical protein